MSVRYLIYIGTILCLAVFCYALYRVLTWLAIASLFVLGGHPPPSFSNPLGPTPVTSPSAPLQAAGPPATVLPAGYRGLALICSDTAVAPSATSSQPASITVPESGVVCVVGTVPPIRWIYSDGTTVSFSTPTSDSTFVYATYTDHYVKSVGSVWMICIGNRTQHQLYEPQETEVFTQFVASGCSPTFEPPHESPTPPP